MSGLEPGIYANISMDAYQADPARGRSGLVDVLTSVKHYEHKRDNPKPATPAMRKGTYGHLAILEPVEWAKCERAIEGDGRTKAIKEARAEQAERVEAAGGFVIDCGEYDDAEGMAHAVLGHPVAAHLLLRSVREQVHVWDDEVTGIRCRVRPDALRADIRTIVDLKTTGVGLDDESLARLIYNSMHHMQAAMYLDGVTATGVGVDAFAFIFVESSAPYDVRVVQLDNDAIEIGRRAYQKALERVKFHSERPDAWRGISDEITTITLPRWAWSKESA